MSRHLKYYEDENVRHKPMAEALCSRDEAERALRKMARHFKIPMPALEFTSGSRNSHFRPTWHGGTIRLNLGHWETVLLWGPEGQKKEVVFRGKCGKGERVVRQGFKPTLSWLLVAHEFAHAWDWKRRGSSGIWHDKRHARLVDRAVAYIIKKGWLSGALKPQEPQVQERVAACPGPDDRIEKRRAQVRRLETKIKGLTTRLKRAKRSLGALERAQARKGGA